MLDKSIQKEYKKAPPAVIENIRESHSKIVTNLEIEDRVFKTTESNPFITVKDHKPNFQNNPGCRLINTSKPEIGKISKQITAKINQIVRQKTKFKQWQSNSDVINWFKEIENKKKHLFIQFDVINFYPSISADLMESAINWARSYTNISERDKGIIMEAKKSLIFVNNTPWVKKGGTEFDIAQGSYDGAEACELVGLYVLSKLQDLGINVGIYRDDGLAVSQATKRQIDCIKKKIQNIFNKLDLKVTIEPNQTKVNFLDITMDLQADTYSPYIKPNTTPLYIHSQSNHPPSIIRNIPLAVNKRVSSISSNESVFEKAAPIYNEALRKSGYKTKLKYDPEASRKSNKTRKRPPRKVTWYNPPFSQNVETNVGQKFLKLVDNCFPPNHPLRKICNRNTLKIGYKCTPNIGAAISAQNSKLLKPQKQEQQKTCNCKSKEECPVQGKCLENQVIYRATVTEQSGKKHTYTGLTSNTFKSRWDGHNYTFTHEDSNQTTLSSLTHTLRGDLQKKNQYI